MSFDSTIPDTMPWTFTPTQRSVKVLYVLERLLSVWVQLLYCKCVSLTLSYLSLPSLRSTQVVPGETALAFFTAKNNSDKAVIGVATYNVIPSKAALYFNKIQCFCFEEQRLEPHEEIDMPVFFFIDPEMLDDPALGNINDIILSYTFFKTGEEEVELPATKGTASASASVSPGVGVGSVATTSEVVGSGATNEKHTINNISQNPHL